MGRKGKGINWFNYHRPVVLRHDTGSNNLQHENKHKVRNIQSRSENMHIISVDMCTYLRLVLNSLYFTYMCIPVICLALIVRVAPEIPVWLPQRKSPRYGDINLFPTWERNNSRTRSITLKTLRPKDNCRHFSDYIFKWIFVNGKVWILIENSICSHVSNLFLGVQITLFQHWFRPGDKPLSEPMMISLQTHICVTRPQWINFRMNSLCKSYMGTRLSLW